MNDPASQDFEKTIKWKPLEPGERIIGLGPASIQGNITIEPVSYTDDTYTVRIRGGRPGEIYVIPAPVITYSAGEYPEDPHVPASLDVLAEQVEDMVWLMHWDEQS